MVYIVDHFSYTPVYGMVGRMGPIVLILFLAIMRCIERVTAMTRVA